MASSQGLVWDLSDRVQQGFLICNAFILATVVILLVSEIPHELPEPAGLAEHEGKVMLILIGLWLVLVGMVLRKYSHLPISE